jgi:hypothetical protein
MSFETHDPQSADGFDFDIDDVTSSESKYPIVFARLRSTEPKCVGLILFCVASIVFGLVMFLLHAFVISGNNHLAMHASSTLPILMGFFAGSAAWSLLSTPSQVRVSAEGIDVGSTPARMIPWEQIGGVIVDTHNNAWGGPAKSLRLMNSEGKLIIKIGGAIEKFDRLIELAREGITQTPPEVAFTDIGGPDTTAIRLGRRRAMLTGLGTVLFGITTTFLVSDGWWNLQAAQRMASEGVDGTGTVVRHFVAPNGITRRIEYEVHGDDGTSATHNVEVETKLHERLKIGDTVQIRFVPGDPHISRLSAGEIQDGNEFFESPLGIVLLGCGGLAMSIFMAVMTVMSWKGYDIKVNGTRIRMTPLGN